MSGTRLQSRFLGADEEWGLGTRVSDLQHESWILRLGHRASQKELRSGQICSSNRHGFLASGTRVFTTQSLKGEDQRICQGVADCGCRVVFEISARMLEAAQDPLPKAKAARSTRSAKRLQPRDFNLTDAPIDIASYTETMRQRLIASSWISAAERSLLTALVEWASSPDDKTARAVRDSSKAVSKEFRSKVEVDFSELLVPLFAWRKSRSENLPARVIFPLKQNHAAHDFCIESTVVSTWHSVKAAHGVSNTFKPVKLLDAIRERDVRLESETERELVRALEIIQNESIEDGALKVLMSLWPHDLSVRQFDSATTVDTLVKQFSASELEFLLAPLFVDHRPVKSEFEGTKENIVFLCNRQATSKLNDRFSPELTRLFKAALTQEATGLWVFSLTKAGQPNVLDLTVFSDNSPWRVEFRSKNSMKRCKDRLGFQLKS